MKRMKHISVVAALATALFCSSCAVTPTGYHAPYGTLSLATNGYNTSVAWTNASYDANGFPIFGYSYGRPVYGYTAAGAAIFSIAALTALCYVPRWKPAPWYHGHHHHPPHCHYVAAPPRHPHGHAPGVRPPGGVNAPIHRNPGNALHQPPNPAPNNMLRPGMGNMNRPPNNMLRPGHHTFRPNAGSMPRPGNSGRPVNLGSFSRPGSSGLSRPSATVHRPVSVSRPTSSMGSMGRVEHARRPVGGFSRPGGAGHRPSGGGSGHRR